MQRYLVVGMAKTGTTVISKTIQNTLGIQNYFLEPNAISFFERFASESGTDGVVKILYDSWFKRPRLLNAILFDELGCKFTTNVLITRDPRAEFISRLHYIAYAYFVQNPLGENDKDDWVSIFRKKEEDPAVPLSVMIDAIAGRFGCRQRPQNLIVERYADLISRLPENRRTLLRYEDFVTGSLSGHPLEHVLGGNREVGADLARTRRSAGNDDWMSFVTDDDIGWMQQAFGPLCIALGYPPEIPDKATRSRVAAPILPANSSEYVARLIDEAAELAAVRGGFKQ